MENVNNAEPSEVQIKESGLSFKGLYQVFTSPTEFFTKLKDDPKVLVPLIVLIMAYATVGFLMADLVVEMQINSPQMQEQLQSQPLPESARTMMWWGTIIVFGIVTPIVISILAAALALFWGNFVFAGKAKFKTLLSAMIFGELIQALGHLLIMPMALTKQTLMVGYSLAVLSPIQDLQHPLYLLLSKIDLFIIWEVAVLGIGLSIIYNLPRNKGYLLSVLSMGMLSILHVVFTAVGSLF